VADLIAVTFQLQDADGNPMSRRWIGEIWLSDSDFGDLATAAPTGGVSVTTGQQLGPDLIVGKHLKAISDSSGTIKVDVVDSGSPTIFIMVAGLGVSVPASMSITFS